MSSLLLFYLKNQVLKNLRIIMMRLVSALNVLTLTTKIVTIDHICAVKLGSLDMVLLKALGRLRDYASFSLVIFFVVFLLADNYLDAVVDKLGVVFHHFSSYSKCLLLATQWIPYESQLFF